MDDARDGMVEDSIGSAKPPKPRKPRDPERTRRLLLPVIAVAAVATAALSGVSAWENHQDRMQTKNLYCTAYAADSGQDDPSSKQLREALDC
jgi:hypothetical protein